MPRPRRTNVASSEPRVVTSSTKVKSASSASNRSKTASMAPVRKVRGGAAKFKSQANTDEIESSGQAVQKQPTKKTVRKPSRKTRKRNLLDKMVNEDDDVEADEVQTSAVDMLKARMSGEFTKQSAEASPSSRRSHAEGSERQRTSPVSIARPLSRVTSTPGARHSSVLRGRTPSVQPNTDDDLYGLSPAGKVSQARFAPRRSSIPRAPLSALKIHGTPGMETSVLALQNFKRRPRQPSLIRMVQQSTELQTGNADTELDDTLRDFDEFVPQDESTPLNFGKNRQEAASTTKSGAVEEPRTSSSRKRKRAVEEADVQIPGSSPYGSSPPRIRGTTWALSDRSSSLPAEDRIAASAEEPDSINAEPLSQSDTLEPSRSDDLPASPKRQKKGGKENEAMKARPVRQKAKKAPKISTAQLQSLLPRPKAKPGVRNAKRTTTYDLPSDSDEEPALDDDELSRPAGRRRATAARRAKTPLANRDANAKPTTKASFMKAKQKRTYSRQKSVEQENDDSAFVRSLIEVEEEDTTDVVRSDKATGKGKMGRSRELERARKMFAKVDEWEMEFESVDLGGGESSPWR